MSHVWLGGRRANPNPTSGGDFWLWDHSGTPIDADLWAPGEPNGGNAADYIDIIWNGRGLCDYNGFARQWLLCETSASNLVC